MRTNLDPLDDQDMPWPLFLATVVAANAILAGVFFGIAALGRIHPALGVSAAVAFLAVMVALSERDGTAPASSIPRAPSCRRRVWRPLPRRPMVQERTAPPPM